MTTNDDRHERADPDDSIVGVVAEPFERSDDSVCFGAGVMHLRKYFGVVKPCVVTTNFKVNPTDFDAVAKAGDSFGSCDEFHQCPPTPMARDNTKAAKAATRPSMIWR